MSEVHVVWQATPPTQPTTGGGFDNGVRLTIGVGGADGADGASRASHADGASGADGADGASGADSASGADGADGAANASAAADAATAAVDEADATMWIMAASYGSEQHRCTCHIRDHGALIRLGATQVPSPLSSSPNLNMARVRPSLIWQVPSPLSRFS